MIKVNNREIVRESVIEALEEQEWFQKRKDTLLQAAQAFGWIGAVLTPVMTNSPYWVTLVIGVIVYISTGITTAFTKGAIPPSAAERLGEKAVQVGVAENQQADELTYQEIIDQRYSSEEVNSA